MLANGCLIRAGNTTSSLIDYLPDFQFEMAGESDLDGFEERSSHQLIAGISSMRAGKHLRYANLHRAIQLEVFERIISSDDQLMTILEGIKELELPDGWLASGALYQSAWNVLTEKPQGYGIKDYDVIYFDDKDLSYEAEDTVIQKCADYFEDFPGEIEVRNQARVPLWYPERFGGTYPVLSSAIESLDNYTTVAHMVGVRLDERGYLEIAAPKGLNDLFSMTLRPNKKLHHNALNHARKSQSLKARWPEVTVIDW